MNTSDLLRHDIIKNLPLPRTEKFSDAMMLLWEQMAVQIISIVGEGGFNALYTRSVVLARQTYPWLEFDTKLPQDFRFAELKMCLERQTPQKAREANVLLLITFTDILATLIGELLTNNILILAWGRNATGNVSKESA